MGLQAGERLIKVLEGVPMCGSEAEHPTKGFGRENKVPLAAYPGYVVLLLPWVNSVHNAHRTRD